MTERGRNRQDEDEDEGEDSCGARRGPEKRPSPVRQCGLAVVFDGASRQKKTE